MPSDTRLTFQIEGLPDDSGDVRLESFAEELTRFQDALRVADRAISGRRKAKNVLYRVVDLSHQSPACVTVEGFPVDASTTGHVRNVSSYLMDCLTTLRKGNTERIDSSLIDVIEGMTQGVGEKFSRILIKREDSSVAIDDDMARAFIAFKAHETSSWGTVRGHVERYNTHGKARYFVLYPRLGGSVRCEFSKNLIDQAAASVERNISVTGLMKYRPGHYIPYRCTVEKIEIHEPDDQLPELQLGVFPNITGEMTTFEYLQEIRDGWD